MLSRNQKVGLMGVGAGLCIYDVVVKSSRSLSHLLMSLLYKRSTVRPKTNRPRPIGVRLGLNSCNDCQTYVTNARTLQSSINSHNVTFDLHNNDTVLAKSWRERAPRSVEFTYFLYRQKITPIPREHLPIARLHSNAV